MNWLAWVAQAAGLICLVGGGQPAASMEPSPSAALRHLPADMVWAWERTEDLRWLPPRVGVAYVATSVLLEGASWRRYPRVAPLRVRPDTPLVPVLHVDMSRVRGPKLNARQQRVLVQEALKLVPHAQQSVLQLDFEVRRSQRPFLQATVAQLRRALPRDIALSMTALASWCDGDTWLAGMAADEVVPMVFRMGRDANLIRSHVQTRGSLSGPKCEQALGTATDEPLWGVRVARHYYFSPRPWTQSQWQQAQQVAVPPNASPSLRARKAAP